MKTIFAALLLLTQASFAAEDRKVSSSTYFNCIIEREAEGRVFKKNMIFTFPTEKGAVHEARGSQRWNNYSIKISNAGVATVTISELIKGKRVQSTVVHQMGKDPEFASFKVKVVLKGKLIVPYSVSCGPE